MWDVEKIVSKGAYLYAVVKNHPHSTKNGYVLFHRIVMENEINRILRKDEIVHHKDGNKKNNKIENLQIKSRLEHSRDHGKTGLSFLKLKCPECGIIFIREKRDSFISKKGKYSCCSRRCNGKFSRKIQLEGITEELLKKINENIIEEFKKAPVG